MLKKFIAVSLVSATVLLPATGAFALEGITDRVVPSSPDVQITAQPGSDVVTIMSTTWQVNASSNFRKTPSPTGEYIGSHYAGDLVNGNETRVVNGVTWVNVYSYKFQQWGWIQASYLVEYG